MRRKGHSDTLQVHFMPSCPMLFTLFVEHHPLVSITLEEWHSNDLIERLRNERIDAAFIRMPPADACPRDLSGVKRGHFTTFYKRRSAMPLHPAAMAPLPSYEWISATWASCWWPGESSFPSSSTSASETRPVPIIF
jgi:DNA-binding transcriptional LysR family regulator